MPESSSAEEAATQSIKRVAGNSKDDWVVVALRAARWLARKQPTLTSESIWEVMETYYPDRSTPEPRAMGSIMRRIAASGVITATDQTVKSGKKKNHNRPLRVWKSNIYCDPGTSD